MNLQSIVAVIVGIVTIISAIYKLIIEPSIDAKIANLETKGFLLIDNLKDKISERITVIDRKIDIHLEGYANYKDANLLHFNGLNEKITHTWNKTKELLNQEKIDRKESQAFLQKQYDMKIHE